MWEILVDKSTDLCIKWANPKAMEHEPRALFLCSAMKKCISSADYIHPACAQTSCCIFLATARILAREKRDSGLGWYLIDKMRRFHCSWWRCFRLLQCEGEWYKLAEIIKIESIFLYILPVLHVAAMFAFQSEIININKPELLLHV